MALVAIGGVQLFGSTALSKVVDQAACIASLSAEGCDHGQGAASLGEGAAGEGSKTNPKWTGIKGGEGATYERATGRPFIQGTGESGDILPSDVSQGRIANCYLIAGLAALAQKSPDTLRNGITKNDDGTYTVTLYQSTWGGLSTGEVKITVTPDFPKKDGSWVFAQPGSRDGGDS